jgi:hypothetical protein
MSLLVRVAKLQELWALYITLPNDELVYYSPTTALDYECSNQ